MLDNGTIALIKGTAPILREHGETLTRHFYKRMFSVNPEVAPYFNPANQMAGRQQRALAGAILDFASNADNLGAIGGAVEHIAQKHASLQIKAGQYPIVGENLLASISEVLGLPAEDKILTAWGKAYGVLAEILIERESQIYADAAAAPGGWEGFKPFRILRKERESALITSFYLVPEDGAAIPAFKPGQYITLRVPTEDGLTTMRQYSLSDRPGRDWLRISVKREDGDAVASPAGYVSNLLYHTMAPGDRLEIAPPCGEFFLDPDDDGGRPLVLIAGGIGITPLLSMVQGALAETPQREIVFIHGSLNEDAQAFKPTLDALADKHPNLKLHYRYSEPANAFACDRSDISVGFIDEALIDSLLPTRDARYYFCGPTPFLASIYRLLRKWEVPTEDIHFEFFGPYDELNRA